MFKLADIAYKFENDLNNAAEEAGYEWKFHVWTSAGYWDKPEREENTVSHTITGELKSVGSAIEANAVLNMGVNSLSLTFLVPTFPPRSSEDEEAKDLLEVQEVDVADGEDEYAVKQIAFLNTVESLLSNYFTPARSETWTDDETTYSVGIRGGVAIPQMIDLASPIHSFVPMNIYIELTFVEGGTNSLNVEVYMDGVRLPLQSFHPERSSAIASDVTNGDLISKTIATSSAFATQFTFPSNSDDLTDTVLDFLLGGEINKAHFLKVVWGTVEKLYLVVLTKATGGAEGTTNASFTVEITEAADDIQLLSFPDTYTLYYSYSDCSVDEVVLTCTVENAGEYYFYANGTATAETLEEGENYVSLRLSDSAFIYDEDEGAYKIYIVTNVDEIKSEVSADKSEITFFGYVGKEAESEIVEINGGFGGYTYSFEGDDNIDIILSGNIMTVTCSYTEEGSYSGTITITSNGMEENGEITVSVTVYSALAISGDLSLDLGNVYVGNYIYNGVVSGGSGSYSVSTDLSGITVYLTSQNVLRIDNKTAGEEEGIITITDTITGETLEISISYYCWEALKTIADGFTLSGNVGDDDEEVYTTIYGKIDNYTVSINSADSNLGVFDRVSYVITEVSETRHRITLTVSYPDEYEGTGYINLTDNDSGQVVTLTINYSCTEAETDAFVLYAAIEGHEDDDGNIIYEDADGNELYLGYCVFYGADGKVFIMGEEVSFDDNDEATTVKVFYYNGLKLKMGDDGNYYDEDGNEVIIFGAGTYYDADGNELTLDSNGVLYDADGNELTFTSRAFYYADGTEGTNMAYDIDTDVVVATEDSEGNFELSMDTAPDYLVLGITGGDGKYTSDTDEVEIFECYGSYFLYVSSNSLSSNSTYVVIISDGSGRSVTINIQTYESV